jgi:putative peptide zinc metalloprotease protein
MKGRFLSEDWYRVAQLRPRLRSHVDLHRQVFRGDTWYVVQDLHSGKYHRITPAGNQLISFMNGRRNVQELWEIACERFPDDPPTQSEVIHLLSQLHSADLIASGSLPDLPELGRRHYRESRRAVMARLRNPLAMRFGLFDPDNFLSKTVWLVRPIFTIWGFLVWLALVVAGVTLAALHFETLTAGLVDRVLSAENIVLIAFAYPLVKAIHELGHAYATKVWGGEVHEIGMMLLVLIPVPYVDASASAAFPEKWRRAVVGGAGIMVELALASAALIFWLNAEPGLARAFAFNVMLIGGVSTLLFNGNPLLRFDGYFVFSDVIEIPNLGQRSNKYIWYLLQRYVLGVPNAESPVTGRGERPWLFFYSMAAFIYRLFISIAISLFIASKLFFIGILLAIWSLSNAFLFPLLKGIKWLLTDRALRGRRRRALTITATAVGALGYAVLVQPVPWVTLAPAVVMMQEDHILRAGTDGFVQDMRITHGEVAVGDVVVRLTQPDLDTKLILARLQRDELGLRFNSVRGRDPLQAASLLEQRGFLNERIALLEYQQGRFDLRAAVAGRVIVADGGDMVGRFVKKGEPLGYIISPDVDLRFRVAVPEAQAELVRAELVRAEWERAEWERAKMAQTAAQAAETIVETATSTASSDAGLRGTGILGTDLLGAGLRGAGAQLQSAPVQISLMRSLGTGVAAKIVSAAPEAQNIIPGPSFASDAGGPYALDPSDPLQTRVFQRLFTFDVVVPSGSLSVFAGERAVARFDLGHAPLGQRIWRSVRQLFLRQFNV